MTSGADRTAGPGDAGGVEIREAGPEDQAALLALVGDVMGWAPGGAAERMWRWKHHDNPAGPSPTWLAWTPEGQLLGVRTFLRWKFLGADGPLAAVRAVDTVTAPEARGRGLFKRLTLHGLERLAAEGVAFVFNTPNDQSRPGYLSMGWRPVERLTVAVQPRGPWGVVRMATSRVPASLESAPVSLGRPAAEGLDDAACAALVAAPGPGVVTIRDAQHLRWRYAGLPELGYRVVLLGADPAEGVAVVRARTRGSARELTVAEIWAPTRRAAVRLIRRALTESGSDYALALPASGSRSGGVRVPRLGPLLVARQITSAPPAAGQWRLSMGDIELF